METTPQFPQSGSIETLLGYKGTELASITDLEFQAKFPDIFNFEKSLRDNAGLIKGDQFKVSKEESEELALVTQAPTTRKATAKEKNEAKRAQAIKELVELQRE